MASGAPTYGSAGAPVPPAGPPPLPEDGLLLDPSVKAVLADPEVQAALESGAPGRLERLLRRKRKFEPDPGVKQAIGALLADRRLFVRPIRSAPGMFTFNGIGTKLYGRRDYDPSDGTYIATLWFVVLFIPIFPIRQYLVRDAGGNAYNFFGKVAMTGAPRTVRLALLLVLPLAVAAGSFLGWLSTKQQGVHFINGLTVPVRVTAGDRTFNLGVNARERHALPVGPCHFRVTDEKGRTLEEHDADIPSGQDLVAYNVLGAAPLVVEEVIYSGKTANRLAQTEPSYQHKIGTRLVVDDRIEYVFTEPPNEIQVASDMSVVTRRHAFVIDGGWQTSLNLLEEAGNVKGAADLLEAVCKSDPTQTGAMQLGVGLIGAVRGQEGALAFAEELVALAPDSVEAHRALQAAMMSAGRTEQARERYRRFQTDHPDSPMACYLRARVEPLAASMGLYGDLSERFPDYFYAVHGCAYQLALSRRFAEAIPLFEKAQTCRPSDATFAWDTYLSALVGAGRADDAVARLVELCRREPDSVGPGTAILYGRLVRLLPGATRPYPADHFLPKNEEAPDRGNSMRAWFQAHVNGTVDARVLGAISDPDERLALQLTVDAGQDPVKALSAAESAAQQAVNMVDDAALTALACEAGRFGREELARKLLDGISAKRPEEMQALTRFALEGIESDELAELDLAVQAALHLARARRAQASGQSPEAHLASARADDLLGTVVTRAAEHWPPAGPDRTPSP